MRDREFADSDSGVGALVVGCSWLAARQGGSAVSWPLHGVECVRRLRVHGNCVSSAAAVCIELIAELGMYFSRFKSKHVLQLVSQSVLHRLINSPHDIRLPFSFQLPRPSSPSNTLLSLATRIQAPNSDSVDKYLPTITTSVFAVSNKSTVRYTVYPDWISSHISAPRLIAH